MRLDDSINFLIFIIIAIVIIIIVILLYVYIVHTGMNENLTRIGYNVLNQTDL
ncbi:hypothetical protein MJ1_0045 [Nanobdella aerobiophila]|uniref:Uncharacterized protein n=1 Tax=Nanobdella aerobiophila TaxID=2586965 RepID=A0A915SF84_9ARCH|nr:hypothetical protein [Nanobdella aerobiophila]BBL45224.1 hypothetical protein MJ1_0045 [Nanobdella aerobiophila]